MPRFPHLKLRIEFERGHLGPGKVELLEHIQRTGSLAAAARAMNMSYKRAWELLTATNDLFSKPVTISHPGRNVEGATQLTEFGERLIVLYRAIERRSAQSSAAAVAELAAARRPGSSVRRISKLKRA